MKRAALLLLLAGAPLALLAFPRLRHALARKARFLLLLWSGAVLAVGLGALIPATEVPTPAGRFLTLAGIALLGWAFVAVLRDTRR